MPRLAVWDILTEDELRFKEWDLFIDDGRGICTAGLAEKGRCSAACGCIAKIDIERGQLTERLIGPVDDVEGEYDAVFIFLIKGFQCNLPEDKDNAGHNYFPSFYYIFLCPYWLECVSSWKSQGSPVINTSSNL